MKTLRNISRMISAILCIMLICMILPADVCATSSAKSSAKTTAKSDTSFVHTKGRELVCDDGTVYTIKGISMGNDVWSSPTSAPVGDHDESSFRELSDMGFNCVRFYLNYSLFESDKAPYKYRKAGFDWLDRNISWAKKYHIRLILNMHYPQGGYQSQGGGDALWTDKSCQDRLTALWGKIADRYADEDTILGYGLVNEPIPVGKTSARDGLRVWQELAQRITDRIRKNDEHHIIFVEKVLGVKDPATRETDWSLSQEETFITIKDRNVVYEFHSYDPFRFTHQGFSWAGTENVHTSYPNNEAYFSDTQWITFSAADRADVKTNGRQRIESRRFTVTDAQVNAVGITLQASRIGKGSTVYADSMYIDEYDAGGKLIGSIYCDPSAFGYWSADGSGSGYDTDKDGIFSLCIRDTTSDANMSSIKLAYTKGHTYRVRGYIQTEKAAPEAVVTLRLDQYHAGRIIESSRDILLSSVQPALAVSKKTGCPVYCGEYGAGIHCFEDRGGEKWVSDMMDILTENGIGCNYHSYKDGSFGLYYDKDGKTIKNTVLERIFRSKYKAKSLKQKAKS